MGIVVATTAGCSSSGGKASLASELNNAIQLQKYGELAAAETLYLKIIKAQPSNYYAQYDLGVIAQTRGQLATALSYYGTALTANPNYVPAMFNEAIIFSSTNPANAIATYKRVISIQPTAPTAYLNLGFLENSIGQVKQGTRDLATAVEQDPSLISRIPKHLKGLVQAQVQAAATATATP